MNREIDPEKVDENEQPEDSKSYNKRLLDSLFSDETTESPHDFVKDYILKLLKLSEESTSERQSTPVKPANEFLSHDALRGIIGRCFEELGWIYGLDVPSDDPQSSHKFDIVAQKEWYTIVVEIRPQIDIADLEQISTHIEYARNSYSRIRFFIGTDFVNIRYLLSGDDITDVIVEYAMHHQLGIIFANHEQCWLVPAEFLLINIDF